MKKGDLKTMRILGVAGFVLAASAATMPQAIAAEFINGNTCRAANLAQASKLAWDHARIFNPGPTSLWVTCAQPVTVRYVYNKTTGNQDVYVENATRVAVWFDSSAAGASVTCIARDLSDHMTGTLASKAITKVYSAPATLPKVVTKDFDYKAAGFDTLGVGGPNRYTHTITCLLPAHTGINAITSVQSVF